MSKINMRFLILFAFIIYLTHNAYGLPMFTITVANSDVSTECKEEALILSSTVVPSNNCTFLPENNNLSTEINSHVKENTHVLVFNINFKGFSGNIIDFNQSPLYKPTHWVLARGRSGKGLLLLDFNYEILSIFTLSMNTENMDIYLNESRPNCTDKLNSTFEVSVRELIFNNLKEKLKDDFICNMHIVCREYVYICCHRNSDGTIKCEKLTKDAWFIALDYISLLLALYVILDFPRFVPEILYKTVYKKTRSYKHRLEQRSPLKLNVVLTRTKQNYCVTGIKAKRLRFKKMETFNKILKELEHDVVYNLEIKEIDIKVDENDLILEGDAPLGLLSAAYDFFVLCKLRKVSSVSNCCNAEMCPVCRNVFSVSKSIQWVEMCPVCQKICQKTASGYTNEEQTPMIPKVDKNWPQPTHRYYSPERSNKNCRWYIILRGLLKFVTLLILVLPVIVRIWVYSKYEKKELHDRGYVFSKQDFGLLISDLYENPATRLGIIVFFLIPLFAIILLFCIKPLRQVYCRSVQKSFRLMRKRNISKELIYLLSIICNRCTVYRCMIVCCLCRLCYCILFVIRFACYAFSSLFVYLSVIFNVTYNSFNIWKPFYWKQQVRAFQIYNNKLYFLFIILHSMTLFLLTCFISLVPFYVDVTVYTSIGVILNISTMLKYLSLTFGIVMYAKSGFNDVANRYLSFYKTIYKQLQNNTKDLDTVTGNAVPIDQNENRVYRIKTNGGIAQKDFMPLAIVLGKLRWRTPSLVLFIKKKNLLCIPKPFFYEASKMPNLFCPGEILVKYLRAFGKFILIVAYLVSFLVIVLAFEGTLSPTNQLIYTVAGQFVPWIVETVLPKHVSPSTETTNSFNICFNELLETYTQDWPINDIVVEKFDELQRYDGYVMNVPEIITTMPSTSRINETYTQSVFRNNRPPYTLAVNKSALRPVQQTRIDLLIDMHDETEQAV